jgi:hypothetical protein
MGAFLGAYWYALVLGACGIGFLIWALRRLAEQDGDEPRYGISDYLLLWPLLLTKRENGKTALQALTRSEVVGGIVVVVTDVLAVIFTPSLR